jgi:hypothetical protein
MNNLIFDVDDYFDGYHMKKYQVDLVNYVDRVRGVRNKAWGPWRDISPEAWDFYRAADPDLFKKRNKIIHEQTIP